MSDNLNIRPFDPVSDADWEAFVGVTNAAYPDHLTTVGEMRAEDKRRAPEACKVRCLAEKDGEIVGAYNYGQSSWNFHPRRFWGRVVVLPAHRERGIGAALYEHLLGSLAAHDPLTLRSHVREDWGRSVRFVTDRGFFEEMREWESRLDVAAFDPAPWEEARTRPAGHGIAIRSLRELELDPERDNKCWELENETARDVPGTESYKPLPFERYRAMILESPNLLPDAFIIAVDETTGQYVGSSNLWKREADNDLQTGLTAVRREYRRKGVAMALKLRVIDYARSVGAPVIRTENATTNRPMLSINEALGFVKDPAWLQMVKEFVPGAAAKEEAAPT